MKIKFLGFAISAGNGTASIVFGANETAHRSAVCVGVIVSRKLMMFVVSAGKHDDASYGHYMLSRHDGTAGTRKGWRFEHRARNAEWSRKLVEMRDAGLLGRS